MPCHRKRTGATCNGDGGRFDGIGASRNTNAAALPGRKCCQGVPPGAGGRGATEEVPCNLRNTTPHHSVEGGMGRTVSGLILR